MVNNLFEFIIAQEHGDSLADLISVYGDLFEKLHIHLCDYEEDFAWQDWDDEDDLQAKFKRILLKEAQDNDIIPEDWDIEESFNFYNDFSIVGGYDDRDVIINVVTDFKDWTGIELDIID